MISDLRFAFRALTKTPAFTAAAILILALGIGANTAVFSVVEAVLLRPLPYRDSRQLVALHSGVANQLGQFNIPEFIAYRDRTQAFAGLAAVFAFNTNLVDHGEAQAVQGLSLSAGGFDLLGVKPVLGRLLTADDDQPGAPKVAVINERLWQRAFGGKADIVGHAVLLNGQPRTIVGVLPADFLIPLRNSSSSGDVCVPLQVDADPRRDQPASLHFMNVFGRLAPGVTRAQAAVAADAVLAQLRRDDPADFPGNAGTRVNSLIGDITGTTRPVLLTLLGVVGLLLLLASVNLAGLLLVRGLGRQREFAIRAALGCTKSQLVRLLLTECLLLALAGGVAGVFVAQWSLDALLTLIPATVPRAHAVEFNGLVLGFTALVSLLAGLVPGLAPLWLCSWVDLREAVSAGGRGSTGEGARMRLRHVLAAVQIALALALLVCTGLFLRSFWALDAQRPGADPTHILTARLTQPAESYPDIAALVRYSDQLRGRLAAQPLVEAVGSTSLLPLASGLATAEFKLPGQPVAHGADLPSANYQLITPGYFQAMGIPLLEGRAFTDADDAQHPLSVIVSRTLADRFFPGHQALGQPIELNDTAQGYRRALIVGVVGDVKQRSLEDAASFDVYVPFRQMDPVAVPWMRQRTWWVVRSADAVATVETVLRREVHALDASVPIVAVATMKQVADSALAVRQFTLVVTGFLAGTALLLTITGVYTTIAYGVAQRTREMGVRLALGATGAHVYRLVVGEGLALVGSGAALGMAASLIFARLIASQLYGVGPHDPAALAGATLLLFLIAFVACSLPARRAARVDPIVAMRTD
ncbi:MAG TPA: ABC transporter permease [Lacunisphaera sp.]|nr:ABC transporter permease [Lacunisphaera sp.]